MTHPQLQILIDQLLDQEVIDPEVIPPEWRDSPEVKKLLRMARVVSQIEENASGVSKAKTSAGQLMGVYRLLRLIGSGGMGDVWLAERADGAVEHQLAIKRVRGSIGIFSSRLDSERRILARLTHPNIARFMDAGLDERDMPWLAMEYVDGKPITEWCNNHKLNLRARIALFRQVCDAVAHAHRHLVVHRDIKPNNVLVDREGTPKLLDFGIAKLLDHTGGETTIGVLTPSFASPEQLRGEEISAASDVYSLGLLLYCLLAGTLPSTRATSNASLVISQLEQEETQRPSKTLAKNNTDMPYSALQLSGDLDAIVAQAMRAKPDARYASVGAFSDDLLRWLEGHPVRAREPTRRYRFNRFVSRNKVSVGIAVAACIGLVTTTTIALIQARNAQVQSKLAIAETLKTKNAMAEATRLANEVSQGKTFFIRMFNQIHPQTGTDGFDTRAVDWIERSVPNLDTDLPNAPHARAELRLTLASALNELGRPIEVTLPMIQQGIKELNSLETQDFEALGTAKQLEGKLMSLQGQFGAAEKSFEDALAAYRRIPDIDPILIEHVMTSLGVSATKSGNRQKALAISSKLLEARQKRLGKDAPELTPLHNNVANNLAAMDRIFEAEQHFLEALRLLKKTPDAPKAHTAQVLNGLVSCLITQMRSVEAKALAEQARDLSLKAFGPDSFNTGIALSQLGGVHDRLGLHTSAADFHRDAIKIFVSKDHAFKGAAFRYKALHELQIGKVLEAQVSMNKAIEESHKTPGLKARYLEQRAQIELIEIEGMINNSPNIQAALALFTEIETSANSEGLAARDGALSIARMHQKLGNTEAFETWSQRANKMTKVFREGDASVKAR